MFMNNVVKHFENIKKNYGEKAHVQIPNGIFKDLSSMANTSGANANINQISFAYGYLVCVSFLYKYTHFVDIDNMTYIQNSDIKEALGYSRSTKSVDYIIKRNGALENKGLIRSTRNYPVMSYSSSVGDNLSIEFSTIDSIDSNFPNYKTIKDIVKNRNYEIREPRFLFEYKSDIGTLYDYSNTYKVTISEFMSMVFDKNYDNIDFVVYSYFKSMCHGLKGNKKSIPLIRAVSEIGISKDTFYSRLNKMKSNKLLRVIHKPWVVGRSEGESNDYIFLGF